MRPSSVPGVAADPADPAAPSRRAYETRARLRVRIGFLLAVLYLALAHPTPLALSVGGTLAFAGLVLRGLTAGHLHKNRVLATSGPYAYTRNPLYLGSAVIAAGFLIAGRSLTADVLGAAYFAWFYGAAIRHEEGTLRRRFGAEFDRYAARVPSFLPWRGRAGARGEGGFAWSQYVRNREYQAALGFLAGLVLLWAKMRLES